MAALRGVTDPTLRAVTLHALFSVAGGVDALELAVDELCRAAAELVAAGCGVLVLSDREMSVARSSTFRCRDTAGIEIDRGAVSSVTVASRAANSAMIARRVGSDSAENTALS